MALLRELWTWKTYLPPVALVTADVISQATGAVLHEGVTAAIRATKDGGGTHQIIVPPLPGVDWNHAVRVQGRIFNVVVCSSTKSTFSPDIPLVVLLLNCHALILTCTEVGGRHAPVPRLGLRAAWSARLALWGWLCTLPTVRREIPTVALPRW